MNYEFTGVFWAEERWCAVWDVAATLFYILKEKYFDTIYINKIQQDATDAGINYCKLTLHVSGVYRPHHQEYIKL